MAASGAKQNDGTSSILHIEETLDETNKILEKKKKKLLQEQQNKAPYLVGSIAEVSRRVSKLDRKLQSYTALVVESRNSDKSEESVDHIYFMHQHDESMSKDYEKRLKEIQDVNQFAGIYAIKSTFLTKPSERAKHISQISMDPSKAQAKKAESGKPKFVELHQFPGYDKDDLTELPHDVKPRDVLRKVAEAQPKLLKTPLYKPEFERLFYSQMSQAILQDIFWFIFLEKWAPNSRAQQGMFNRVAHNYVKLLLYAKHPQYRQTFLSDYTSFLAQGVYAAYCEAFPDSYRQFDYHFKEDVVNLVYEWVSGLRPAPRTWTKWNMEKLEPPNIKSREELLNQSKSKKSSHTTSSLIDFSFLDQAPSHISGSLSTLNQVGSTSSFSSHLGKKNKRSVGYKRQSIKKKACTDLLQPQIKNHADSAAKAQESTIDSGRGEDSSHRGTVTGRKSLSLAEAIKEDEDRKETLTPIREFDEDGKSAAMAKSYASYLAKSKPILKESHPIGRGPEFGRSAFNIYGKSPLVAQYLRMQNLRPEAGVNVLVQRTEIESLPPIDGKTYADLTRESFKRVKTLGKQYQKHFERDAQERTAFVMKQKATLQTYLRKQGALLSQKREVKRLCDLIMLELKKDRDSVSANAIQALEQALMSQEV